jgi:SAM-dependent methyltransferase
MMNLISTIRDAQTIDMFTELYADNDDPWHIDHGWYEQRKRALLMASLPRQRFDIILEPGCGSGALSIDLASRCQRLIACDIAPRAIELARQRLASCSNVELACCQIPFEWPAGIQASSVDCIIISELAYYLQPQALTLLLDRIKNDLRADGVLVACHWQGAFPERTLETRAIHDRIAAATGLPNLAHHEEQDFLLDIWSGDARSVAMCDGLA